MYVTTKQEASKDCDKNIGRSLSLNIASTEKREEEF